MSYKEVWYKLKDWINLKCLYDFDTIAFIDIYEKLCSLEYLRSDINE